MKEKIKNLEKDKLDIGLSFLTLSLKYLCLVENISHENIKQGNPHILVVDEEISSEKYEEMTKWSDFNISIPFLFNLYHGLELLLKGFLFLRNDYIVRPNHNIEKLFKDFKKKYNKEKEIILILKKYLEINLMPDFLANCLKNNSIQINNLYEFLKYPTDKKARKIYDYIDLKYKEEKGSEFFENLASDLNILVKAMVKLYKKIERKN